MMIGQESLVVVLGGGIGLAAVKHGNKFGSGAASAATAPIRAVVIPLICSRRAWLSCRIQWRLR